MSIKAKVEAIIYAAEEPVTLAQLVDQLGGEAQAELDASAAVQAPPDEGTGNREQGTEKAKSETTRRLRDFLRAQVQSLIAEYANNERGMEIREVAGGYRMGTKPEYHDTVRGFVKSLKQPLKLTLQALETLAVVAYKQPVTAPEISEIRGVDSTAVLGGLMGRKLITTAGRKQVIGRPILYKTTKEFLMRFGLKDIGELPSIEEFEKMAGELAEPGELPLEDASAPAGEVAAHHQAETD
jgi:segregation and condensation protein B